MHIFVTGATGWIGSEVVRDLLDAGHSVTGLTRSPDDTASLEARGASSIVGALDRLEGEGLVRSHDGEVRWVRAGDIVWWSPGERHWEGAAPDRSRSCVVRRRRRQGAAVGFGERVTDEE